MEQCAEQRWCCEGGNGMECTVGVGEGERERETEGGVLVSVLVFNRRKQAEIGAMCDPAPVAAGRP